MDQELFELCKEVYERFPEWTYHYSDPTAHYIYGFEGKTTGSYWEEVYDEHWNRDPFDNRRPTGITHRLERLAPLYTSDYLLEKLPRFLPNRDLLEITPTMAATRWCAGYFGDSRLRSTAVVSDTPLKALLKLVITLDDKGELG